LLSLRTRYEERRSKDLVSLMRYLENPDTKQTDDEFKYSSKVTIINCAKSIMKRNCQADIGINGPDDGDSPISDSEDDLSAQLKKSIFSVMASSIKQKIKDQLCALQKEFKLYEADGVCTPKLDKLDAALKSI
jgi:hypothetical protein